MRARILAGLALCGTLATYAWEHGPAVAATTSGAGAALLLRFWVIPAWAPGSTSRTFLHMGNAVVGCILWVGLLLFLFTSWIPIAMLLPVALLGGLWFLLDRPATSLGDALLLGLATLGAVVVLAASGLHAQVVEPAAAVIAVLLLLGFGSLQRGFTAELLGGQKGERGHDLVPLTWLLIVVLPCAIYFPMPRHDDPILDIARGNALERVSGFSTTVDLTQLGLLKTSDQRALRARVRNENGELWTTEDEEDPDRHPLLLRGRALGHFDGRAFRPLVPPDLHGGRFGRGAANELQVMEVEQEIILAPHGRTELFALDRVTHASAGCDLDHGELRLSGPLEETFTYTVRSLIIAPEHRPRLALHPVTHPDGRYRTTPPGIGRRLPALARDLVQGVRTDYDKVRTVERWLKQEGRFSYSRFNENDGPRPLERFALETRKGHCEFFASTMVVMLRSLGLPARVAVGYRGGTWSERYQVYEVLQRNAHAWVEVPFEDVGWVPFDPTPAESRLGLAVNAPGREEDDAVARAPAPSVEEADDGGPPHQTWSWTWALALATVVAVWAWFSSRGGRAVRAPRGDLQSSVRGLKARLVLVLVRAGAPQGRGVTLREMVLLAPKLDVRHRGPIGDVVTLIYRSRFGGVPLQDHEVRSAVQTLNAATGSLERARA